MPPTSRQPGWTKGLEQAVEKDLAPDLFIAGDEPAAPGHEYSGAVPRLGMTQFYRSGEHAVITASS